jgi:hypothetical protein
MSCVPAASRARTDEEFAVRIPVALNTLPPTFGSDPARAADADVPASAVGTFRADQRRHLGRAYRAGRLVCGCVHVTVLRDGRLGLAPHERRVVWVRFHEPVDDDLRAELTRLVRRRGSAARRMAERADPIEVVVDDARDERQRLVGHLQPAQVRHGQLRAIEFELRQAP